MADRFRLKLTIGEDHGIHDLTACDAMPGLEKILTRIVAHILQPFFYHKSFTACAGHFVPSNLSSKAG